MELIFNILISKSLPNMLHQVVLKLTMDLCLAYICYSLKQSSSPLSTLNLSLSLDFWVKFQFLFFEFLWIGLLDVIQLIFP
jgi:hypothetical protein